MRGIMVFDHGIMVVGRNIMVLTSTKFTLQTKDHWIARNMYMNVTFASAKVYWTWLAKWFLAMTLWSLVRLCDLGYMVLGIFQIVFHNILSFLCLRNCSSSHHSLPYCGVFGQHRQRLQQRIHISECKRFKKVGGGLNTIVKYHKVASKSYNAMLAIAL